MKSTRVTCFGLAVLPIGWNTKDARARIRVESITGPVGPAVIVRPNVPILTSALEVCAVWVTNWTLKSKNNQKKRRVKNSKNKAMKHLAIPVTFFLNHAWERRIL